eukprot:5881953-Prymnesium_polylepis.1
MEDRGAEIDKLAQFPSENEIVFSPLTAMEVNGYRVDELDGLGAVLIIEVLPVVNPRSLKYEDIFGKRHKLLKEVQEDLVLNMERELAKKADTNVPIQIVVSGSQQTAYNGVYELKQDGIDRKEKLRPYWHQLDGDSVVSSESPCSVATLSPILGG